MLCTKLVEEVFCELRLTTFSGLRQSAVLRGRCFWTLTSSPAMLSTTYQRTLECTRDPGSLRPDLHRCPPRRGHTQEAAGRRRGPGCRRACQGTLRSHAPHAS